MIVLVETGLANFTTVAVLSGIRSGDVVAPQDPDQAGRTGS
ncbi:MAG: hypothetical protein ABSC23_03490 [Bryobacteraceae bacterium]|jgi:hypothetical protein